MMIKNDAKKIMIKIEKIKAYRIKLQTLKNWK